MIGEASGWQLLVGAEENSGAAEGLGSCCSLAYQTPTRDEPLKGRIMRPYQRLPLLWNRFKRRQDYLKLVAFLLIWN